MLHMLGFIGIFGLVAGIFAAAVADVFPAHRSALQGWGGGLLVGSVALLGLAFPML
jgi:hypothetical protein